MRRHELGDLDFVVQQRCHPLLRFAHDAKDDFIGRLRILFPHRMGFVFADHQTLSGDQLAEFVRPGAEGILLVGHFRAMLVVEILAGDDDPVEEIIEQRRRRNFRRDLNGVVVERLLARHRRNVLRLLALRVLARPAHGVNDVVGGHRRAVVKLEPLAHMKQPVVGILDFPALQHQADMLPLVEIIGTETAQHLAPDAIHQRHAVGVWIESVHGLGHADGDARLRRAGMAQRRTSTHAQKQQSQKEPFHNLSSIAIIDVRTANFQIHPRSQPNTPLLQHSIAPVHFHSCL